MYKEVPKFAVVIILAAVIVIIGIIFYRSVQKPPPTVVDPLSGEPIQEDSHPANRPTAPIPQTERKR